MPTMGKPDYQLTKPDGSGWWAPTHSGMQASAMGGVVGSSSDIATLYMWGPILFQIFPLNVHEVDHETGTDWAHKEIAGAPIYREWVGENDELVHLRGRIFPFRIGGLSELEYFEASRRAGVVHILFRGNPVKYMGWFACERLVRSHTWLSSQGVGQQVTFEAVMARMPVPESDTYFSQMNITNGAGT